MLLRILITGGAGFIGSHLALRLKEKGHFVTILDNLSPQVHGERPEFTSPLFKSIKNVKFILGDITNRKLLENIIHEFDVIFHFAAETGTGQSMYEIARYSDVNIGGTALLLDIIANKKNKIKKIVLASSRAVYGEGKYFSNELGVVYPNPREEKDLKRGYFEVKHPGCKTPLILMPTDEDSLIHPISIYGITKQVQEQILKTVATALGIPWVIFRYQNVYGPGQSLLNPYTGILSIFSSRILNNRSINIFEDGKESRDFVFIDDAIDATILGLESENANGEVFNVGSGVPVDVLSVANELMKNLCKKVPVRISGNYRIGDIRHNYADLKKIESLLGYKPRVSFQEGIKLFAKWVKKEKIFTNNYSKSLDELKSRGFLK